MEFMLKLFKIKVLLQVAIRLYMNLKPIAYSTGLKNILKFTNDYWKWGQGKINLASCACNHCPHIHSTQLNNNYMYCLYSDHEIQNKPWTWWKLFNTAKCEPYYLPSWPLCFKQYPRNNSNVNKILTWTINIKMRSRSNDICHTEMIHFIYPMIGSYWL